MDLKIEIRQAVVEDSAQIQRLNKEALSYDYNLQRTTERLDYILKQTNNRVFVAVLNGNICGYIHGADYECTYTDSLKNIMAIAVDESRRGLGIGRRLLCEIENWAMQCGCEGVRLVSGFERQAAHNFYLGCGYSLRKEAKNFIKYFSQ